MKLGLLKLSESLPASSRVVLEAALERAHGVAATMTSDRPDWREALSLHFLGISA